MARVVLTSSDLTIGSGATSQQRIDNVRKILDTLAAGTIVELPEGEIYCKAGTPTSGSAHDGEIAMPEGAGLEGGGGPGQLDSAGGGTVLRFETSSGMRCVRAASSKVRGVMLRNFTVRLNDGNTNVVGVDLDGFQLSLIDGVAVHGVVDGQSVPYTGTVGFLMTDRDSTNSRCFYNRLRLVSVFRMESAFGVDQDRGNVDRNHIRGFQTSEVKHLASVSGASGNTPLDIDEGYAHSGLSGSKLIALSGSGQKRINIGASLSVEGFTDESDVERGSGHHNSANSLQTFRISNGWSERLADRVVVESINSTAWRGGVEAKPEWPIGDGHTYPYVFTPGMWVGVKSTTKIINGKTFSWRTRYDANATEATVQASIVDDIPRHTITQDGGLGAKVGPFNVTVSVTTGYSATSGLYYREYVATFHVDKALANESGTENTDYVKLSSNLVMFIELSKSKDYGPQP